MYPNYTSETKFNIYVKRMSETKSKTEIFSSKLDFESEQIMEDLEEYIKINKIFINISEIYNFKLIYLIQPSNFSKKDKKIYNLQEFYVESLKIFLNKINKNNSKKVS
jgi:hypothetical protein